MRCLGHEMTGKLTDPEALSEIHFLGLKKIERTPNYPSNQYSATLQQ